MNPASRCESCLKRTPTVRLVKRFGVALWLCAAKACRSKAGRWRALQKWGGSERRREGTRLMFPELERRRTSDRRSRHGPLSGGDSDASAGQTQPD